MKKPSDLELLEKMKALKDVPAENFDEEIRKIVRVSTRKPLWFTNNPSMEWDGEKKRECNYRCCPTSRSARHFFCLLLERENEKVSVRDGFLAKI